jgi:glutamate racemase
MIGVFDSGLGGLSVLKEFLRFLPQYDYIYLGDSARVPYGGRTPETIYTYTCEALDFLFDHGCELVILACNTASASALRRVQQEYLPKYYPGKKVLGVIFPLAEAAAATRFERIGVIGTRSTIASGVYAAEIAKLNPRMEVFSRATPLLVPLIEEGWSNKPETRMILKKYLHSLKVKRVQALILGCTHYPFILPIIKKIMGKHCLVFDPGKVVAASLSDYLYRHQELNIKSSDSPVYKFYTTDDEARFRQLGERFLGVKMDNIERIRL